MAGLRIVDWESDANFLAVVIGSWTDEQGTWYHVSHDDSHLNTATVKIWRNSGEKVIRKGIIHVARRGHSRRVVWGREEEGSYYVDPTQLSKDFIFWSKSGGKGFPWHRRHKQNTPPLTWPEERSRLEERSMRSGPTQGRAARGRGPESSFYANVGLFAEGSTMCQCDGTGRGFPSHHTYKAAEGSTAYRDADLDLLAVVLGDWEDQQGTWYRVTFDDSDFGDTASVKLWRIWGKRERRKGIIRIFQRGHRGPRHLVWGRDADGSYHVDAAQSSSDVVLWQHNGVGQAFLWRRRHSAQPPRLHQTGTADWSVHDEDWEWEDEDVW